MLFHLKWPPSEIKQATQFDLKLAIEEFDEVYGNKIMDDETLEELKQFKDDHIKRNKSKRGY